MWRLVWLLAGVAAIPPHQETARVARFVAHMCDWGALATISTQDPPMRGQPFANVFSVSDGPAGKGSGVPYMYLTELEISVHDLKIKIEMTWCILPYMINSRFSDGNSEEVFLNWRNAKIL